MIILENEIKKYTEAKNTLQTVKECLWPRYNQKRDRQIKRGTVNA